MSFTDEQMAQLNALIAELKNDAPPLEVKSEEIPTTESSDENSGLELRIDGIEKSIDDVLEFMRDMPELKSVGYYTDDGGDADKSHKSLGDFLLAVKRNDVKRIREVYGSQKASEAWEKDISGDSGAGGGYLIPTAYEPTLLEVAGDAAVVRPRATVIPVSTRSGEIPSLDQYTAPTGGQGDTAFAGGVVVAWADEGATLSETQPTFKMLEWNIRKLGAYTEVPNETVADSAIAIEALITRLFGTAIAGMEDYAFLRGDGVGKPLGILSSDCAIAVTTATNNTFAIADALAMRARFKSVGGAPVWIIHPGLWPDIGIFEVGTGGAVFLSNVPGGIPQSLLGYPILESEHMPQDDYDDALLADLAAYVVFDRSGVAVAFSEHAAFTSDKGTWRVTKRLDGQPWLTSTITLADPQGSYTVSPFVYHDD